MNENIDVRMSNYLTILGNQELRKNFDSEVIRAMETAVAIYTAKTARDYIDNYKNNQKIEETNKLFK